LFGAELLVHLDHVMEVRNRHVDGLVQKEEPAAPGRRTPPLRGVGFAAEEIDERAAVDQRRTIAAISQAAVRETIISRNATGQTSIPPRQG
jgi:hypothetical protein